MKESDQSIISQLRIIRKILGTISLTLQVIAIVAILSFVIYLTGWDGSGWIF